MDTLIERPVEPKRSNPITTYVQTLRAILTRPAEFFRAMPLDAPLVPALVFAVITHWLGSALAYLWQTAAGGIFGSPAAGFSNVFDRFIEIDSTDRAEYYAALKQRIVEWMWGVGSVIVDPFKTVVSILVTSFFVWLGARLLVQPTIEAAERRLSYENAVKLVAFGLAPSLLQGVPMVGPLVAWIYVFVVTVIGARELYRVSAGRGAVIVLFPKILLAAFFTAIFVLLMFMFFQLFFSAT